MKFDKVGKIASILSQPFLTAKVISHFFKTKSDLSILPLKNVIKRAQEKVSPVISEKDLKYVDWLLRILSLKFETSSPCLCHALSLFSLGPKEALLLLYAKKEASTLDGHAAVQVKGQIFSTATGWHTKEPFTEFRKIHDGA